MLSYYRPLRHIRRRLKLWWLLFNILLLTDEMLKEGYVFKPGDIGIPLTHENLLVLGNITFLILYLVLRRRR